MFKMTNFNVDEKRGKIILHTGSMNGGKSYALIEIANQVSYSKHNALAFIPKLDSRSKNCISAMDNAMVYPAVVVNENDPEEILNRIYKEDSKRKIDAVIIDETNFFNIDLVKVVRELKEEKRVVILGGLDYDFRGEPFGPTPLLKIIADEIEFHYPNCSIVHGNVRCSKPAKHTIRLLKTEDDDNSDIVNFEIRRDETIRKQYVWAPYYSPTVLVEGSIKGVVYSAACEDCFRVPRKAETLKVYNAIVKNDGINYQGLKIMFPKFGDLDDIIDFLVTEKRVIKKDEEFLPQKYVKDYSIIGHYRAIE